MAKTITIKMTTTKTSMTRTTTIKTSLCFFDYMFFYIFVLIFVFFFTIVHFQASSGLSIQFHNNKYKFEKALDFFVVGRKDL